MIEWCIIASTLASSSWLVAYGNEFYALVGVLIFWISTSFKATWVIE